MNPIAPALVGKADHRRLDDTRKSQKYIFHFARIDIVPTRDQHVVFAIEDVEEAITVHPTDVARMQPAVAEDLCGLLRAVPIMGHGLRAAADDLAVLPRLQGLVVGVEYGDIDHSERPPA